MTDFLTKLIQTLKKIGKDIFYIRYFYKFISATKPYFHKFTGSFDDVEWGTEIYTNTDTSRMEWVDNKFLLVNKYGILKVSVNLNFVKNTQDFNFYIRNHLGHIIYKQPVPSSNSGCISVCEFMFLVNKGDRYYFQINGIYNEIIDRIEERHLTLTHLNKI